jgi:hypothetical protein
LFPSRSRLAAIMDHDVLNSVIAGGQISKYRADINSCAPGMKSGLNSLGNWILHRIYSRLGLLSVRSG